MGDFSDCSLRHTAAGAQAKNVMEISKRTRVRDIAGFLRVKESLPHQFYLQHDAITMSCLARC